jgi:hypothetical protein
VQGPLLDIGNHAIRITLEFVPGRGIR